jgi:Icc-related predicted phosphoesterase
MTRPDLWFFTSDLHGQTQLYEQALAGVAARRPAAVLIGGDLAPHAPAADGVQRQRVFLEGLLVEFARRLAEASPGTRLLLMMGNDDWRANAPSLEAHHGDLWDVIHERRVVVEAIEVAGLSWVPITPFGLKDWERWEDGADEEPARLDGWISSNGRIERHAFDPTHRAPTIAEALDPLAPEGSGDGPRILVTHSPPRDTCCDLTSARVHVGSRAIRAFVETRRPALVLSGHIHESPRVSGAWRDAIGPSIVVNPGQFGTSRLCGVWFDPARPGETLRHTVFS